MKSRSGAGGKTAKLQNRKTAKPKRITQSNTPRPRSPSTSVDEEIAPLKRELKEAREQQAATSEVLRVISTSRGALEPVFQIMLESAARICEAPFGSLCLREGDVYRTVAMLNAEQPFAEFLRGEPWRPSPHVTLGRALATKRAAQTADITTERPYIERDPVAVAAVELGGYRTVLAVPMLKESEIVGAIMFVRQEVRPFTDEQIALVQNFAAQAVIAIENARLLNELRQRTDDLTERTDDLTEALEQQTATSEVLQVVSSSPGDLEPVFSTMLENAVRICGATFGNIYRRDGEAFRIVTSHNAPAAFVEALKQYPYISGKRMVATKSPIHVADATAQPFYTEGRDPEAVAAIELGGVRTFLAVPMLKDSEVIGAFLLNRQEVRPFTDKQIELVKNFAAQAVIAIENARLLNELRQSLEQQTASSEVLKIISTSQGDLQPVFEAMVDNATRICQASLGTLTLYENGGFRHVALHRAPAAYRDLRAREPFVKPHPAQALGRLASTKKVVHVTDVMAEPEPARGELFRLAGARTLLIVPMLKDEELLGAIGIYRQEVKPFSEEQINLLKNFADQAVIAIENARLLNELRQRTNDLSEALEQQTATSDVLHVISSSPGDLDLVFTTMLEKAVHICDAKYGTLYLPDDGRLRLVAAYDVPEFFAARRGVAFDPAPGGGLDEALRAKRPVQIPDLAATKSYIERHPGMVEAVELAGIRTGLAMPMLKDDDLIGIIAIHRREVLPFTDKQIELVKNFAAQAVIAIENTRLLNDLRQRTTDLTERTADLTEALEQQTATSEVLQVISSSPGDLQPVFATMLENAVRICDAKFGNIYRWDGDALHLIAAHNTPPAFAEARGSSPLQRPGPKTVVGRMLATKTVIHVADLAAEEAYIKDRVPPAVAAVELGGVRTILAVPMLNKNELIGSFTVYRQEVRPFTDKQMALITNFASQAVIAIENARLLRELRERTEQVEAQSQELVKLNQQLEHRVADQVGEIERMGRLRRFLPPQVADLIVASGTEKQLESHRREITALFCDLRGFTGFTESADAEDVIALLREYHAAVGEKIIKYSGTLERYAGDGVMVVFNDPVPVENPALQAVLMALEMRDAIGALTETWHRWGHDIGFGIGIAHGFATLGTIGFEGRFDYAAIGTVSNVASRLCDEAKPGQILISPRVLTKVENAVKVEPVGEFELKGIRRPLAAYNVVAASPSKV